MNKIEQMVKKMCPGGVEMVPFKEVANYIRGVTYNKTQEIDISDCSGYKILRANNIAINTSTLDFNDVKCISSNVRVSDSQKLVAGDILICAGSGSKDHIGKVAYINYDLPQYAPGGFMAIVRTTNNILPKFLFQILKDTGFKDFLRKELNSSTINNLNSSLINRFEIPLPPLPIQEAIVEILDKFESLQQGLQDELQARKKQYEYYRNKLINNKSEYVQYQLCDIALLKAGKAIRASELSAAPDSTHPYPCYGGNGIRGYIGYYSHEGEYSIIGRQGALCGCINYAIGRFYATEHAVVCTPSEKVDTRFLYHLLSYSNLNQYKSQGAQPGLAVSKLNELLFKIPGISEQTRIASFLDHFETLVNDQEKGIPAEISAVKKQYEYYRNKLLTFSTQNYKE